MLTSEQAFEALQATYPPLAADAPLLVAIEDDAATQFNLRLAALMVGCAIEIIGDLADADVQLLPLLQREAHLRPTVLLVDQQLPYQGVMANVDGWAVMGQVMQAMLDGVVPPILMVAVSADMTEDRRDMALKCGAYRAMEKPFLDEHLRTMLHVASDPQRVAAVLHQYRMQREQEARGARSLGRRLIDGVQSVLARLSAPAVQQWQCTAREAATLTRRTTHRTRIQVVQHLGGADRVAELMRACMAGLDSDISTQHLAALLTGRLSGQSVVQMAEHLGYSERQIHRWDQELWDYVAAWLNANAGTRTL